MKEEGSLTALEKSILTYLHIALSTTSDLYKLFFYKSGQKHKTRKEVMRRKLEQMKEKGYLNFKRYKTDKSCIVVITEIGALKLGEGVDYLDLDSAWTHLPREGHGCHDLLTGETGRKFYNENENVTIFYEPFLRSEAALLGKRKRGLHFPDYRISFMNKEALTVVKSYNVEIVAGGVTRKDFLGKIRSSHHHLMVITKTAEMTVFLYNYTMELCRSGRISNDKAKRLHFTYSAHFFAANS